MNFSFQDEVKTKERAPPPNLDDERRRLVEVIIIIKSTIRDVCIPKQIFFLNCQKNHGQQTYLEHQKLAI